jgi:hypothetical protein
MQNINSSPNIATLDSKVVFDLCVGQSYIDVSPSVWIGTGYDNVLGVKVQITNPLGVVIKPYPTGYDVTPATSGGIDAIVSFPIPTQAGNYQYGKYSISVQLVDADGTIYTDTKTVSICAPDANNKTKKYGSLTAKLSGICADGKVYVLVSEPPTYKGFIAESSSATYTLNYPTGSGMAAEVTTQNSFSVQLFEGVYGISGSVCAQYNFGDNVFVKVQYKVDYSKPIICSLDECCVFTGLDALNSKLNSDCSQAEKEDTQDRIQRATLLLSNIDFGVRCGQDVSEYISDLEDVLGLTCSCAFDNGTPIVNNNPASDIAIQGCNVEKEVVGLTTVYTLNLYSYVTSVTENGGVLGITNQVLDGCVKSQTLTFNIAAAYSKIKGQINNSTEYNYWASILNKSWDSIDISCLGVTQSQWNSYTYAQRSQAIVNALCAGGNCAAIISGNSIANSASDVNVSWSNVSGVYEVSAYLDGQLKGTVLSPVATYKFIGAADGIKHNYTLVAKCSNGASGITLTGNFEYYGCPVIAPPTVTSNNISSATCPYNLTALVNTLPAGIVAEWHNANSTSPSSIVSNPTATADGIYFVFAKNADGCYSTGVQVILSCSVATGCSAPQSVIAEAITGGVRIRFQSAAYPPPSNSYTVKRRLSSDPDISGSYTTIGSPSWDVASSRWQILDSTALANTLYTWRVISNCTSSAPYSDYQFANIACPSLTLTTDDSTVSYSFANVGGQVDKYEVSIYESDGVTLVHTDTILPAFSSPITGTFTYLDSGTSYKVRTRIYIGSYYKDCPLQTKSTNRVAKFGDTTFLDNGQPAVNEDEIANIQGTPAITVTITLDTLENDNGGTLEVNGTPATQGDTWNVVLDAGGNGSLNVSIVGAAGNPGTHILGHFTITAVSSGAIGTPNIYQISKVF